MQPFVIPTLKSVPSLASSSESALFLGGRGDPSISDSEADTETSQSESESDAEPEDTLNRVYEKICEDPSYLPSPVEIRELRKRHPSLFEAAKRPRPTPTPSKRMISTNTQRADRLHRAISLALQWYVLSI